MTSKTGITGVRSVDFGLPDLETAARFYEDVWGLAPVAGSDDRIYLRGTGPDFYILALHRNPEPKLLRIDLNIESRARADALHASLAAAGLAEITPPGSISEPGGGYGFTFRDAEGRVMRVLAEAERHAACADRADFPRKITHVVLNSPDRTAAFFTEQLGFRLIDQTGTITFLCCGSDHHSIALYWTPSPSANHVAFEMPDLDSVMRGAGRMLDHGHEIAWGVGRHGPANNVFCYFIGPGGFVIEYTSEVEQVDENYKAGTPQDWTWPP
ncbi:MAG: VOC family protein, partial [Burkholderiales bacterium]|nr:VOC family protein [Burkholderiales bacterium]